MSTANPPSRAKELLQNHLAFLRNHRGKVSFDRDTVRVESARPEFTYLVLGESAESHDLLDRFNTIHLAPWSALTENQLKDRGCLPKGGLTYMTLGTNLPPWKTSGSMTIRTATTPRDMDLFSEVQSKGFLEKPEAYAIWHPFLRDANHRNLGNRAQSFYIGSLNNQAVGVVLTVVTGELAGIYAVATLPEFRKKGVSATIMSRAIEDARNQGCREITLQVAEGSYAESFYERLGFRTEFKTKVFSR
ncbi:MAG: GNAT family N-acetyltransferase [Oligoflexia bacterium]|nr:GNAT family N-acetyltransferase [Oligoflexia bacterium]